MRTVCHWHVCQAPAIASSLYCDKYEHRKFAEAQRIPAGEPRPPMKHDDLGVHLDFTQCPAMPPRRDK